MILSSVDENFQSVSVNPREFKLPPYRLEVGSLYVVKLTVKHLKSLKSSSSQPVQVFVSSGDLVCVLLGGEGGKLGLRLDESLLLDMSRSYDTNYNINGNNNQDSSSSYFSFELSCFQTFPSFQDGCNSLIFTPSTFSFSQVVVRVNSSFVPEVTTTNKFVVVMRGRSRKLFGDDRSCESVVELSILDSLAPVLRLEVISGLKMNPSSKLKILGSINMKSSGKATWSVNDNSILLSSVSLSPLSQYLPPSSSSSSS